MIKIPCKDLREFLGLQQFELEDGTRLVTSSTNYRSSPNQHGLVEIQMELFTYPPVQTASTPIPLPAPTPKISRDPVEIPVLPEKLW